MPQVSVAYPPLNQGLDMMYMGKYDKNAKNGEAAFKLYNFTVNAAPKNCIVSFVPLKRYPVITPL